jgi:hypothetical protein
MDGALSRAKRYERLRNVFRYALAHGMISSKPTETLKGIRTKNGDKVKDFSDNEVRAILEVAKADVQTPAVFNLRFASTMLPAAGEGIRWRRGWESESYVSPS